MVRRIAIAVAGCLQAVSQRHGLAPPACDWKSACRAPPTRRKARAFMHDRFAYRKGFCTRAEINWIADQNSRERIAPGQKFIRASHMPGLRALPPLEISSALRHDANARFISKMTLAGGATFSGCAKPCATGESEWFLMAVKNSKNMKSTIGLKGSALLVALLIGTASAQAARQAQPAQATQQAQAAQPAQPASGGIAQDPNSLQNPSGVEQAGTVGDIGELQQMLRDDKLKEMRTTYNGTFGASMLYYPDTLTYYVALFQDKRFWRVIKTQAPVRAEAVYADFAKTTAKLAETELHRVTLEAENAYADRQIAAQKNQAGRLQADIDVTRAQQGVVADRLQQQQEAVRSLRAEQSAAQAQLRELQTRVSQLQKVVDTPMPVTTP
jgi:hypothetical protein